MLIVMYVITASLVIFIGAGLILTVSAVRSASRRNYRSDAGQGKLPLRQRARRYAGPITHDMPLFHPVARIAIEFGSALCGFPGLGWMVAGNIVTGLVLISIVPAFVWAFYPAYLITTGNLALSPIVAVGYLPILAMLSAAGLAVTQFTTVRKQGEGIGNKGQARN